MKLRTYNKQRSLKKRTLVGILSSCAVLVIAIAIIVPIALANQNNDQPNGEPVPTVKPISFVMPVADYTIGGEFKIDELVYSSTLNQWRTHSGVDFLAPVGTPVVAIADGSVTDVRTTTLEGYVVVITHTDGFVSTYKSLGSEIAVTKGQDVAAGTQLGVVDTTMITEQAEGAHLHLELTRNGALVNPLDYIPYSGDK